MPTKNELEEMARDYEQMDRERVEEICRDIMKDELFEGMVAKEELRLLKEGHTIIVPQDIEHARSMFKLACFYLSQYDIDFKLQMTKEDNA